MARFLTSVSLFMGQYYLKFLSHYLQGSGSSPVSLFVEKDFLIPKLLVTFFARMKFLTSMFVHENTLPKLLVTLCARMGFLTKLSLFIENDYPLPKLLVTCFAWMMLLTSVSLFMRQYYLNFLSHSLQARDSFCHMLCMDEVSVQFEFVNEKLPKLFGHIICKISFLLVAQYISWH